MPTPPGESSTITKFDLIFLALAAGVIGGVLGGALGGWIIYRTRPLIVTTPATVGAVGVPVKVSVNPPSLVAGATTYITVSDIAASGATVSVSWIDATVFTVGPPRTYTVSGESVFQIPLQVNPGFSTPNFEVTLTVTVESAGLATQTTTRTVTVNPSP